ncbi:MAG: metal-dependent hydrolase [Candidatus Parvarchaeota archaeon]|nr:metal-dependent hydrolase [Candidatus Jingweiarchaeum tengchongense]MCW1298022.1 metal-dependent hydrolase [Candidatus Jingweiarchaeum tengchongense]MCW1300178.1 metal-dependent hydrolase [Candidatus Jingweiarchaeum tengchongense]MCW1304388.1 metal-dependent hydrolase [Candidatus Jingweiarchaeum tengchongense]MCW1309928.1 metal-dependent hydrolase [Candidatus Jingweiarchaeum tengchongense]
MRRETHFLFAFLVGFFLTEIIGFFESIATFSFKERVANAIFCSFGSLLPDVIEVPEKRKHRKFFHSVTTLLIMLFFSIYFIKNNELRIASFLIGYASHLFLDFFTAFKLPLI